MFTSPAELTESPARSRSSTPFREMPVTVVSTTAWSEGPPKIRCALPAFDVVRRPISTSEYPSPLTSPALVTSTSVVPALVIVIPRPIGSGKIDESRECPIAVDDVTNAVNMSVGAQVQIREPIAIDVARSADGKSKIVKAFRADNGDTLSRAETSQIDVCWKMLRTIYEIHFSGR